MALELIDDLYVGEQANWENRWPIMSDCLITPVADVFTSEKDAKLLSAAPELLSACKGVISAYGPHKGDSVWQALQKMLLSAIDKAEGRS